MDTAYDDRWLSAEYEVTRNENAPTPRNTLGAARRNPSQRNRGTNA